MKSRAPSTSRRKRSSAARRSRSATRRRPALVASPEPALALGSSAILYLFPPGTTCCSSTRVAQPLLEPSSSIVRCSIRLHLHIGSGSGAGPGRGSTGGVGPGIGGSGGGAGIGGSGEGKGSLARSTIGSSRRVARTLSTRFRRGRRYRRNYEHEPTYRRP